MLLPAVKMKSVQWTWNSQNSNDDVSLGLRDIFLKRHCNLVLQRKKSAKEHHRVRATRGSNRYCFA